MIGRQRSWLAFAATLFVAAGIAGGPASATVSALIGANGPYGAAANCAGNDDAIGLTAGMGVPAGAAASSPDQLISIQARCGTPNGGGWQPTTPAAPLGTSGEVSYDRTCDAEPFTGVSAAVRKSDDAILGLQLICGTAVSGATAGDMTTGGDVVRTKVVCGPGNVVRGFRATFSDSAHQRFTGFALQCLLLQNASAGGGAGSTASGTATGGGTSSSTTGGSSGTTPAAGAAAFANVWNVKASDGTQFTMTLTASGTNKLSGTYDTGGRDGEIKGSVSGNVFTYTWKLTGPVKANGAGSMTLAPDGKSWSGTFTIASPLPGIGSWKGSL